MDFVTIDFEATCLPQHGRSYPIEVGISGSEGTSSWLIHPGASWYDWTWTDEARRLHGISPDALLSQGLPPAIVMAELTAAIASRRVIADSQIDSHWWDTLAKAASQSAPCPIEHVAILLDEFNATAAEIAIARQHADRLVAIRHRAGSDAHWLYAVLSHLTQFASSHCSFESAA